MNNEYLTKFIKITDLIKSNDYQSALKESVLLNKQLLYEKAPNSVFSMSFENIGFIYFLFNEFDTSEKMLKKAINLDKNNENAYKTLTALYSKLQDWKRLITVSEDIIKQFPNSKEMCGLAYFRLANAYYGLNMMATAMQKFYMATISGFNKDLLNELSNVMQERIKSHNKDVKYTTDDSKEEVDKAMTELFTQPKPQEIAFEEHVELTLRNYTVKKCPVVIDIYDKTHLTLPVQKAIYKLVEEMKSTGTNSMDFHF